MNLNKIYEFFQPEKLRGRVHIIGCGAIGSTVAENLARYGITNMSLYDFDTVEAHNIANQMFTQDDIGKLKVEAVAENLKRINPEIAKGLQLFPGGWKGQKLAGYVFLAVDNIDLRREIANACKGSPFVKGMFDFRMGLLDGQHYAADWRDPRMVEAFIGSMQFSHEEAKAETPVSACNLTLSVCPSVRAIVAYGVQNFVNFVKGDGIKKFIQLNMGGNMLLDAF